MSVCLSVWTPQEATGWQVTATDADVKQAVTSLLQTLKTDFCYTRIQSLVQQWDKCLNVNGDYVEV